ncbi:MAG: cystathionine gamma-synthase [Acidimicrobiales bacterium]
MTEHSNDSGDSDGSHVPGFATLAIHAGQDPDPTTGAVVTPIHLASTFAQEAVGKHAGFEYSRTGNPTRASLEATLAALEKARFGFCFASGMAAEDALLRGLHRGDHLIIPNDAYGGTYRLVDKVLQPDGISYTSVDLSDLAALEGAWREETRLVWVETPTNPMLNIVDIESVAEFAHSKGGICIVDNTFATPYLQSPLVLGADAVVHSSTKYLGGHSDVVGGFVGTNDPELAGDLGFIQNATGAVPSPFDCYLIQRGVKTLAIRMDRQCESAAAIAEFLASHSAVDRVLYPGLESHPGHQVARRQMADFGAMISFTLKGGEEAALDVAAKTELFTLAESLGAVESLIEHPGRMTHASTALSPLEVDPALLRLSIGLETLDDLLRDLERALG